MTVFIVSSDDSIPPALAARSIADYIEGVEDLYVIYVETTKWCAQAMNEVGLSDEHVLSEADPDRLDTVIGPPDEDLVAKYTRKGAVYLDVSEGLVSLEVDDPVHVPDSPDTENLPEVPEKAPEDPDVFVPPPVEKPKPKPRKRAARAPLAKVPPTAKERDANKAPAPPKENKPVEKSEPVKEPDLVAPITASFPDGIPYTPEPDEKPAETEATVADQDPAYWRGMGSGFSSSGWVSVTSTTDHDLRGHLKSLVFTMISAADTDTLWAVLDTLREGGKA